MTDTVDLMGDLPPIREIKPIPPNDVVISESRHLEYDIQLRPGVSLEDCMVPDIWRNTGFKLHVHDRLNIYAPDDSYMAVLMVRECAREYAHVVLLYKVEFQPLHASVDDMPLGYHVDWLGPQRLFGVFHGTTLIKHSLTSRSEAIQWTRESFC